MTIVHSAVGAINESDVTLAEASNAFIIGFNVRPTHKHVNKHEADDGNPSSLNHLQSDRGNGRCHEGNVGS